jgi:signal transduction histidine kinase
MNAFRPSIPADISSEKINRLRAEQKDSSAFSVSGALSRLKRSENYDKTNAAIEASSLVNAPSVQKEEKPKNTNINHGWTVWHEGTKTQTFFWFWNQQNNLVGLKLSTSHWLSELINQLPDDREAQSLLGNARIKLIDEKQRTIYQWGEFEDSLNDSNKAQGQRLLGHPLIGWRLAYFSPEKALGGNFQLLLYIALLILIALTLIGLGIYMLREYRRDMRLAEQRVTFVNQVSHELKTPLTNICMYADLLDSQVSDTDNINEPLVKKYTSVLTTESQRLGRLINNVLSFSRSQKQQQELILQSGSIDDTLTKIIEVFKPAFSIKDIDFELDLNANSTVLFDENIIEQVMNNLLSNVEKYAHQGKLAHISSSQQGEITQIIVSDAGSGVDKKIAKRLFEPFFRGDSKLTEGISGTGIGLSIAKELCQLHGGQLILKTETNAEQMKNGNHQGARFIITLATPNKEGSS